MRKKRAKQIRELAFDIYRNDSETATNHTNVYRAMKRFYVSSNNGGCSRALALKVIQVKAAGKKPKSKSLL